MTSANARFLRSTFSTLSHCRKQSLATSPSLHNLESRFPDLQSRFPNPSLQALAKLLIASTKFHLHPIQLSSKLQTLKQLSFSHATIAAILERFPDALIASEERITSVVGFLSEIGLQTDLIVRLFPRVLGLGVEDRLRPLVCEIKGLGFPWRVIRKEISNDPRILGMEIGEFSRCLKLLESLKCRNVVKERVTEEGLVRACFEVKLRVDCLCGYGLTRRDALKVLWKEPRVIGYEIGDIERKVEFLVQRMGFGVESLAEVPKYIGVSFEKQIVARYSVVEYLKVKGAIGFEIGLRDLVMPSRLRFYNLYVKPYPECEKIYGRFSGGGEVQRRHPAGLWKLFEPQKFRESAEDILEMNPEHEAEEDGANIDLDSQRKGKCVVLKTSTRQTIFLSVVGLVNPYKLKPGDRVNKDSYLILDTLPSEYDSRVKAMEVDEKPTEDYNDIGGLEKLNQELVEAIVLPMTHKERFQKLGVRPPKGVLLYGPPGTWKTLIARACAA
ncbi:hypothetical protein Fmac_024598 [Flemingia macrophylla]|uniref:Uncharacterized protein n=1 Tax=Flemingia macrophylla TaxID=520843 RepID=A0ABD1LPV6_9FABA